MPEEIIMPKLGMTMESGIITKWYKNEGDAVEKDEPIVEIMTDKANMDVEAPVSGTLVKIFTAEGEEAPVGKVIGLLKLPSDTEQSIEIYFQQHKEPASSKIPEEKQPEKPIQEKGIKEKYVPATPFAKRIAKEKKIKLENSDNEVITSEKLLEKTKPQKIEFTPIMKSMAEKMTRSAGIPQFTLYYDIKVKKLLELNSKLKEKGVNSNITAILVKILSYLLDNFPIFNAFLEGSELKMRKTKNVGVAVATEHGLVVPVIKDIGSLSIPEFFDMFDSLIKKARMGKLSLADIEGGSVTISNLGAFGVDSFKALLIPGQSSILAISTAKEKPIALENGIIFEKIMNISISCDHRFIDGATAAKFMKTLKNTIEEDIEKVLKWE